MLQKLLDKLRAQYTEKFPVGDQYSKARDDVTNLLDEIELLKANLENNQKFTMAQFREIDIAVKQIKALEAENAELRARLDNAVELPCKVGVTAYKLSHTKAVDNHFVDGSIRHIPAHYKIKPIKVKYELISEIGKTVFLTREDAQKALKERNTL